MATLLRARVPLEEGSTVEPPGPALQQAVFLPRCLWVHSVRSSSVTNKTAECMCWEGMGRRENAVDEGGRGARSEARGNDGGLVEELEVHQVERLDGVALFDHTRDAEDREGGGGEGSAEVLQDERVEEERRATHLISLAPCEIISMLTLPSARVLCGQRRAGLVPDRRRHSAPKSRSSRARALEGTGARRRAEPRARNKRDAARRT